MCLPLPRMMGNLHSAGAGVPDSLVAVMGIQFIMFIFV